MKKVLVLLVIVCLLFSGCGVDKNKAKNDISQEPLTEVVYVKIVEQEWSGWSNEKIPSTTTYQALNKHNEFSLSDFSCSISITIEDIVDENVLLMCNSSGVTKSSNGAYGLIGTEDVWSETIAYNEGYELATQTMDAGTIWTLTFSKEQNK